MYSILAGFMIGLGGILNLKIGGLTGALFFSIGLMTICHFGLDLFTGKAGLFADRGITHGELIKIWFGNFFGTMIAAGLALLHPDSQMFVGSATAIIQQRISNGFLINFSLGILCGICMYVAVTVYKDTKNLFFLAIPVAAFIMGGFAHCIADQFYCHLSTGFGYKAYASLFGTTIGNLVGCNIIPCCRQLKNLCNLE